MLINEEFRIDADKALLEVAATVKKNEKFCIIIVKGTVAKTK